MSLTTRSKFYYGHIVNTDNNAIDFDEGGSELQATLNSGSYTVTEYANEVKRALDAAGALTYTVTFNRSTGKLTVAATSAFRLRTLTGTRSGTSAYTMMGFDTSINHSSFAAYDAENITGYSYTTQAIVRDYVAPEDWYQKVDAVVNRSASGRVVVVQFGTIQFLSFNIWAITNKPQKAGQPITESATGRTDAEQLMRTLITKSKFEFMPDKDMPNTFYKVIIESTPQSRDGLEFQLQEMQNGPGYYETGTIVCRVVT